MKKIYYYYYYILHVYGNYYRKVTAVTYGTYGIKLFTAVPYYTVPYGFGPIVMGYGRSLTHRGVILGR